MTRFFFLNSTHLGEMPYLFNSNNFILNQEDKYFSNRLIQCWSEISWTGNPYLSDECRWYTYKMGEYAFLWEKNDNDKHILYYNDFCTKWLNIFIVQ